MRDWQNKSDFEINKGAFLLAAKVGVIKFKDLMEKQNPNRSGVMYGDGANWHEWNGCDNPSDAWPIIVDNKIDLTFAVESLGGIGQAQVYIEGDTDVFCEFTDNNKALRAAMIVYLEMNGVKP